MFHFNTIMMLILFSIMILLYVTVPMVFCYRSSHNQMIRFYSNMFYNRNDFRERYAVFVGMLFLLAHVVFYKTFEIGTDAGIILLGIIVALLLLPDLLVRLIEVNRDSKLVLRSTLAGGLLAMTTVYTSPIALMLFIFAFCSVFYPSKEFRELPQESFHKLLWQTHTPEGMQGFLD